MYQMQDVEMMEELVREMDPLAKSGMQGGNNDGVSNKGMIGD
jgi:hypothetical protein